MYTEISEGIDAYKKEIKDFNAWLDKFGIQHKKTFFTNNDFGLGDADNLELSTRMAVLEGMKKALGLNKEEAEKIEKECE